MVSALLASIAFSADVQSIEIAYTERNLVEPARVEAVRGEIRRAARKVCGVRRARTLTERRIATECASEAEARAESRLRRAAAQAGVLEIAAK